MNTSTAYELAFAITPSPAASRRLVVTQLHTRTQNFFTFEVSALTGVVDLNTMPLFALARIGRFVKEGIFRKLPDGRYQLRSLGGVSDTGTAAAAARGSIVQNRSFRWCTCGADNANGPWAFEVYNVHGEYTGDHGFVCPTCLNVVQIG